MDSEARKVVILTTDLRCFRINPAGNTTVDIMIRFVDMLNNNKIPLNTVLV